MKSIEELREEIEIHGKLVSIPEKIGIYKIYRPDGFQLVLRDTTDGMEIHREKKKDGTYRERSMLYTGKKFQQLQDKIDKVYSGHDENVIYIGKADKGKNGKRNLRKRLTEYILYGYKKPTSHRGGRAIWQIENNRQLLVDIFVCDDPEEKEKQEILAFKRKYGVYPFANWMR